MYCLITYSITLNMCMLFHMVRLIFPFTVEWIFGNCFFINSFLFICRWYGHNQIFKIIIFFVLIFYTPTENSSYIMTVSYTHLDVYKRQKQRYSKVLYIFKRTNTYKSIMLRLHYYASVYILKRSRVNCLKLRLTILLCVM